MQRHDDTLEMITDTDTFQKALDAALAQFTEAGIRAVERTTWENELERCVAEIEGGSHERKSQAA